MDGRLMPGYVPRAETGGEIAAANRLPVGLPDANLIAERTLLAQTGNHGLRSQLWRWTPAGA